MTVYSKEPKTKNKQHQETQSSNIWQELSFFLDKLLSWKIFNKVVKTIFTRTRNLFQKCLNTDTDTDTDIDRHTHTHTSLRRDMTKTVTKIGLQYGEREQRFYADDVNGNTPHKERMEKTFKLENNDRSLWKENSRNSNALIPWHPTGFW